jgi:hypothetical protein
MAMACSRTTSRVAEPGKGPHPGGEGLQRINCFTDRLKQGRAPFAQVLLIGSMTLFICAGILISCGSDPVAPRPTAASAGAPAVAQATSASETSSPTAQGRDTEMPNLPTCMLKHWIHSHEEDTPDLRVYRPANYAFPPSRGRVGFEFHEGGTLDYYAIGRADGSEQLSGSWKIEGSNVIKINVNSQRIQPFDLQVVACDDQALKVRR